MVDSEKYSDQCDIAAENEERFRNEAIRAAAAKRKAPDDFDGTHCVECDVEIPAGRLALGCFTCVECQTFLENQKKFYRRG